MEMKNQQLSVQININLVNFVFMFLEDSIESNALLSALKATNYLFYEDRKINFIGLGKH